MKKPKTKTGSKFLRWSEKLLFVAGLAAVSLWAWSGIFNSFSQSFGTWAFEQKRHGQPSGFTAYLKEREEQVAVKARSWFGDSKAPPAAPSSPKVEFGRTFAVKHGELVGRIVISRLRVNATVREGAGDDTLEIALGHISGTPFPGQPGNVGVAGHRDTLFRGLRGVKKGDVIEFQTLTGNYSYQVESTQIVQPEQVSVLNATERPELTLVTCYPFYYVGSAPQRFIVKARQIETEEASPAPVLREIAERPPTPPHSEPGVRRLDFQLSENHSLTLGSEVLVGVSSADPSTHRMNGWMWVVPDRRTIWLRDREPRDPLVFYGASDGRKRELVITHVGATSVRGYLLLFG
jgi:sortase A